MKCTNKMNYSDLIFDAHLNIIQHAFTVHHVRSYCATTYARRATLTQLEVSSHRQLDQNAWSSAENAYRYPAAFFPARSECCARCRLCLFSPARYDTFVRARRLARHRNNRAEQRFAASSSAPTRPISRLRPFV